MQAKFETVFCCFCRRDSKYESVCLLTGQNIVKNLAFLMCAVRLYVAVLQGLDCGVSEARRDEQTESDATV